LSIATDAAFGFRTRWASRFIDAGSLNRETGIGTFNDTTGKYDSPSSAVIWDGTGGCLIRPKSRTTSEFGETDAKVEFYDIFVPYTATGAKPGDKFTVSASLQDSDLVGAVLVLTEVIDDSYLTKYQWVGQRIKS
jgi:hypothetical protein